MAGVAAAGDPTDHAAQLADAISADTTAERRDLGREPIGQLAGLLVEIWILADRLCERVGLLLEDAVGLPLRLGHDTADPVPAGLSRLKLAHGPVCEIESTFA
jgi:hypothetical protein